jgi:hypothetical protein
VWEVHAGDDIVARMNQGIDGCRGALIFVSRHWPAGTWVRDEFTSLILRRVEDGIRVVLVVVEQVSGLPVGLFKLARREIGDFDGILDALLGRDRRPGLGTALESVRHELSVGVSEVDRAAAEATLSLDGAEVGRGGCGWVRYRGWRRSGTRWNWLSWGGGRGDRVCRCCRPGTRPLPCRYGCD